MQITKIQKSNTSKFLATDLYLSESRRLHIGKTARNMLGIEKGEECETDIYLEFVKFDNDLPCRCHTVKVFFNQKTYDGTIVEDLGMRTHQVPVLQIK
jgi:hypothetical protein